MEVLLLCDIKKVGKKNDVLSVGDGFALNHLFPEKKAVAMSPSVRERYAKEIESRKSIRDQERTSAAEVLQSIQGKTVHIGAKVAKTGKLYAAVTAKEIAEAVKKELKLPLSEDSIRFSEVIKVTGRHTVTIVVGEVTGSLTIEVKELGVKKVAAKKK